MMLATRLLAFHWVLYVFIATAQAETEKTVPIRSYKDVLSLFERLNYTPKAWKAGIREIPRVFLSDIPERWSKVGSRQVSVQDKKRIFFRIMGPLILKANELVLAERKQLFGATGNTRPGVNDASALADLAERYRVIRKGDKLDDNALAELKRRIDIVPVSLALAQGAEESGWGTSRFAHLGNAVFGQWTWGGKGIMPKEQRTGKGNYKIAAYESPLDSVKAYIFNINSNAAYAELRSRRAEMRATGETISGWKLAETLTRYSERGAAYVKSLHHLMRINYLSPTDEARLAVGPIYILKPIGEGAQ